MLINNEGQRREASKETGFAGILAAPVGTVREF